MSQATDSNRRKFLINSIKAVTLLSTANVGVYVIGSALKKLDGSLVAGAKACNPDGEFCHIVRGYPDGTNQLTWGWDSFGPPPACTRTRSVVGAGRAFNCPPPYDTANYY